MLSFAMRDGRSELIEMKIVEKILHEAKVVGNYPFQASMIAKPMNDVIAQGAEPRMCLVDVWWARDFI
jgi:hypothetical protein